MLVFCYHSPLCKISGTVLHILEIYYICISYYTLKKKLTTNSKSMTQIWEGGILCLSKLSIIWSTLFVIFYDRFLLLFTIVKNIQKTTPHFLNVLKVKIENAGHCGLVGITKNSDRWNQNLCSWLLFISLNVRVLFNKLFSSKT